MPKRVQPKPVSSCPPTTVLKVEWDETVKDNPFFQKITEIEICCPEIFSLGCLNEGVPPQFVGENDFAYRQSKIPLLRGLYKDWMKTTKNQIINVASGYDSEKATDVSEIIGVAVALKYFIQLIGIQKNLIKKILPSGKQEKRLDFEASSDGRDFEIEAKGTTNESTARKQLRHIQQKKKDQEKNNKNVTRIGIVVKANDRREKSPSRIIVSDSFNPNKGIVNYSIYDFLRYYQFILSVILDNTQYNRMAKFVFGDEKQQKTTSSLFISKSSNRSYSFREREFIGYFFDRRLILDIIKEYTEPEIKVTTLFSKLTKKQGKHKIFIGVEKTVFEALASRKLEILRDYQCEEYHEVLHGIERYLSNDGVLVVFSANGTDEQTENLFSESEVRDRLDMLDNFLANKPHECGAPCRSREIRGKPCEILTFREHCHFHR